MPERRESPLRQNTRRRGLQRNAEEREVVQQRREALRQPRAHQQPDRTPRRRRGPEGNLFQRSLRSGALNVGAGIEATAGAVAGSLGFEDFAERRIEGALETQQRAAELTPDTPRFAEIDSAEEAGKWLVGTTGQQAPNLAFQLGTALAFGSAGRRVSQRLNRPLAGSPEAVQGAQRLTRRTPRPTPGSAEREATAATAGALTGGATAGASLATGDIAGRVFTDEEAMEGRSTQDLSRTVLAGGVAGGSLQAVPVGMALNRMGFGRAGMRQFERQLRGEAARSGALRRTGEAIGSQIAAEVPVDVAQVMTGRATHRFLNDNIALFDDEGINEMIEAAAASAVTAVPTGGISSVAGQVREGMLDRDINRARETRDRRNLASQVARKDYERIQQLDPDTAFQFDPLIEEQGYDNPDVQDALGDAVLRFAQDIDPRPQLSFDDENVQQSVQFTVDSLAEEVDSISENFNRLRDREDVDPSVVAEIREAASRAAVAMEQITEAREQGDAGRAATIMAESFLDGTIPSSPENLAALQNMVPGDSSLQMFLRQVSEERTATQDAAQYAAAFTDEQVDTVDPDVDAVGDVDPLEAQDRDTESELTVQDTDAEDLRNRIRFIMGEDKDGERYPYQTVEASRRAQPGRERQFVDDAADRKIRELRVQHPDRHFNKMNYRSAREAQLRFEINEETDRRTPEALIQDKLEEEATIMHDRMAERAEARGSGQASVARLFDPDNPAAFLENFAVIEERPLPPALGRGDELALSPEEFDSLVQPAVRGREEAQPGPQGFPRGTMPLVVDGQLRMVNIMDAATIMQDRVRTESEGTGDVRAADVVFNALSAILNQPGRRVELAPHAAAGQSLDPAQTPITGQQLDIEVGQQEAGPLREQAEALRTEARGENVGPDQRARLNEQARELDNEASAIEGEGFRAAAQTSGRQSLAETGRVPDTNATQFIPDDQVVFTLREGNRTRELRWRDIKKFGAERFQAQADRLQARAEKESNPDTANALFEQARQFKAEASRQRRVLKQQRQREITEQRAVLHDLETSDAEKRTAQRFLNRVREERMAELEREIANNEARLDAQNITEDDRALLTQEQIETLEGTLEQRPGEQDIFSGESAVEPRMRDDRGVFTASMDMFNQRSVRGGDREQSPLNQSLRSLRSIRNALGRLRREGDRLRPGQLQNLVGNLVSEYAPVRSVREARQVVESHGRRLASRLDQMEEHVQRVRDGAAQREARQMIQRVLENNPGLINRISTAQGNITVDSAGEASLVFDSTAAGDRITLDTLNEIARVANTTHERAQVQLDAFEWSQLNRLRAEFTGQRDLAAELTHEFGIPPESDTVGGMQAAIDKARQQFLKPSRQVWAQLNKLQNNQVRQARQILKQHFDERVTGREVRNVEQARRILEARRSAELRTIREAHNKDKVAELQSKVGLDVKAADTAEDFFIMYGDRPPASATLPQLIEEARARRAQESRSVRIRPEQLDQETELVSEWARNLQLRSNVRVVGRQEAEQHISPAQLEKIDIGRTHGFMSGRGNEAVIYVREDVSPEARVEWLAHELGHVVFREKLHNRSDAEYRDLWNAYRRWLKENGRERTDLAQSLSSRRAVAAMRDGMLELHNGKRIDELSKNQREQVLDFEEWFADNTARWMTQARKPRGVLERFFKEIADTLKSLFDRFTASGRVARADRTVADFLDRMWTDPMQNIMEVAEADQAAQAVRDAEPEPEASYTAVEEHTGMPREPSRAMIEASHAAQQAEFNSASTRAYRNLWRNVLNTEQREVLARAFMQDHVRAQLRDMLDNDPIMQFRGVRQAIERGNSELAFIYGMDAWKRGELNIRQPKARTMMQRIHRQLQEVFSIASDGDRAAALLPMLINSDHAVIAQIQMPPRFQRRGVLGTVAANVNTVVEGMQPLIRQIVPAQSALEMMHNPTLAGLGNMFQARASRGQVQETYFESLQMNRARFHTQLREATEQLAEQDQEMLLRSLRDPNVVPPAHLDEPVARIRQTLQNIRRYAVERGVEMGDRGPDYFPWVFDPDQIISRHAEFVNWVAQEKFDDGLRLFLRDKDQVDPLTQEDRERAANIIADTLVDNFGHADSTMNTVEADVPQPAMSAMNERVLAFLETTNPDDTRKLNSFMHSDPGFILSQYVDQAVKRAEFTRRFGARGERLEAMYEQARKTGASEKDIAVARDFVNAMTGFKGRELATPIRFFLNTADKALGTDWSSVNPRKFRRLQGAMMVYQNMRTLALATLTSLADAGGIAVRSNSAEIALDAFKAGMRETYLGIQARTTGRNMPREQFRSELRRLAETLGTIEVHTINDAMGEMFGGSYMTGTSRTLNDAFFKVIQMQRWARMSRMMALEAGRKFLVHHRDGAYSQHSQRFLEELNLEPADVVLDADGQLVVHDDAARQQLREEGNTAELIRDDKIRVALNRFVDQSVMRPNAAQRPLWASHPDAQLLFHLKQFTYSIHDRLVRRTAQEMGHGNYYPAMAMTNMVAIMIAADVVREMIQFGPDGDPRKEHWELNDYLREGVHRSGVLGLGTFLMDAHKDRSQFGGVGFESLQGPTVSQLRRLSSGIMNEDSPLGPALVQGLPANNLYKQWDMWDTVNMPWDEEANILSGHRGYSTDLSRF